MQEGLVLAGAAFEQIKSQAELLVKSKFLPSSVDTVEKAVAIAMKGVEVGMPMMQSFSHINVISGKPTISAEGMNYLIRKNCPDARLNIKERSTERCLIQASRPGSDMAEFSFSMEDAKTAQLLGNPSWKKYPRNMLFARAMSDCARVMFPDCIGGISYTPEELGADVNVDGEIIDVPATNEIQNKPVGFDPENPNHLKSIDQFLESKEFSAKKREEFIETMRGLGSDQLEPVWENL